MTPYPAGQAPSQRFRFEQYFETLSRNGHTCTIKPFLTPQGWKVFYSGSMLLVIGHLLRGFGRRLFQLFSVPYYDIIFIHREASPLGPPVFEWIIAKMLRKKIIYDFDDAIWLNDPDEEGSLKATLKWKQKVSKICRWSYKVSVGNEYLARYARQYNEKVTVVPTVVNTEERHNPTLFGTVENDKPVIGWTGTHSTLHYLQPLVEVIKQLEKEYDFTFLVISNKNPRFSLKSFRYVPWDLETEISDLMKIDIGLMPLTPDRWSEGKCGFKLIQYMALEKPALASPVGINRAIIDEGINGYLCHTTHEWHDKIVLLLNDAELRHKLGREGRKKVMQHYSVSSSTAVFLSLLE